MRTRYVSIALAVILVTTAALPVGGQSPSPVSPPSGSPGAIPSPTAPSFPAWVPADIAADVDAIRAAATSEEAIAATRAVLERSGVVIADDPLVAEPSAAAVYLTQSELEAIAREAQAESDLSRTSFAEFAMTFGGAAGLTADQAVLDQMGELDLEAGPASSPGASAAPISGGDSTLELDLSSLPARMSRFLTAWVGSALEHHAAAEPELVTLTNAPLYLAALASIQSEPVDLREPFAPGGLQLGMLGVTLLTAGMRAHLAYAQAGILDAAGTPALSYASWRQPLQVPERVTDQGFSDCDQLKRLLDAHVPFSTPIGIGGKEFIKTMVKGFVENLFGAGSTLKNAVGPAFTALGLMFKVAALVMLYEHSVAKLKLEPAFIHKPVGSNELAAAILEAGIPDAEWERAKQQRDDDFWSTALRTCARLLGMPVTRDLIDVGQGIKDWRVRWEITRGLGRHVLLHEGEMSGPGVVASRLERPLAPRDDHSGTDTLAIDVLPEKESDHPGDLHSDRVTVCAHVVPHEPPGGFKTFLSAGFAGKSLAGSNPVSGLVSLAGVIGELLVAWYREMGTIDACANMNVSYHVPEPMPWRGRITVNWESHTGSVYSSVTTEGWGTGPYGEPAHNTSSSQLNVDATEEIYVGGMDEEGFSGYVGLTGRSYVHGAASYHYSSAGDHFSSACHLQQQTTEEGGGGWAFDRDGNGSLSLYPDGTYTIDVHAYSQDEVMVPTTRTETVGVLYGECEPGTEEQQMGIYPPNYGAPMSDSIEGRIDPANPGNRLAGSQTTVWDDGSVTTITWDLVHEGPIRMPGG